MISCEHCTNGGTMMDLFRQCDAGVMLPADAETCVDFDHAAECDVCCHYDAPTLVCNLLPTPAALPPAEGHLHPLGCLYRESTP